MLLKQALQRAVKRIHPRKSEQQLRHVCLHPAKGASPAYVVAGDGETWAQYALDEGVDVIGGGLDADQLAPVLQGARALEVAWAEGAGSARMKVVSTEDTVGFAELRVLPRSQYPGPDPTERFGNVDFVPEYAAHELAAVVHAAGGQDPVARHLAYVHASRHGLAASDGYRIAYVQYQAAWDGLVPTGFLEDWPKSASVGLAIAPHGMAVRLGEDETRWCAYANHPEYPDPWKRGRAHEAFCGARLILPTKALAAAIKQATGVGGESAVLLQLRQSRIDIFAQTTDESQQYKTHLLGEGGERDTDYLIDGKLMYQALRAVKTPKVIVGYRRSVDPLRLEAGRYIECIWPMTPD